MLRPSWCGARRHAPARSRCSRAFARVKTGIGHRAHGAPERRNYSVTTGSGMTAPARLASGTVRRALLAGAALLAVLSVSVSLIEGARHRLPGIALGSAVLLHGERALALV